MQTKNFQRKTLIGVLMLLFCLSAMAEGPSQTTLRGTLDSAGPWVVRGHWTLTLKHHGTKADFSAALNMQHSDYYLIDSGKQDIPAELMFHTHHIYLKNVDVVPTDTGFTITGAAKITVNGGTAPIDGSHLTVEVSGGTEVSRSNVALTFADKAAGHFGKDPLNGVIKSVQHDDDH